MQKRMRAPCSRKLSSLYVFLIVVISHLLVHVSDAKPSWRHCYIANNDVVDLVLDKDSHTFSVDQSGENRLNRKRNLLRGSSKVENDDQQQSPAFVVPKQQQEESDRSNRKLVNEGATIMQGRLCHCVARDEERYPNSTYYCPTDKAYCFIPRSFALIQPPPTCVNETGKRSFTKSLFPIVMVMFALIAGCLLCSVPGRHAISCAFGHVFPCWNQIAARYMMRHNPERANQIVRGYFLRGMAQQQDNPVGNRILQDLRQLRRLHRSSVPATKLFLKTAVFDSSTTSVVSPLNDGDLINHNTCTICFADIHDGDRIGHLPCNHIFHVECLKSWLKRRNVCPLCLKPDIAQSNIAESQES